MNEIEKQHLSEENLDKLRRVIQTKIAGELIIKSEDLERILRLAGQNPTKTTVDQIRTILEQTYHTDEYFLDEIEPILAPYWEDFTDEQIAELMIESFQVFDMEKQGFIEQNQLIQSLTMFGEMPLEKKDFRIMFSMVKNPKEFHYEEFVTKLCTPKVHIKIKNKKQKKKKKKVKRTIK